MHITPSISRPALLCVAALAVCAVSANPPYASAAEPFIPTGPVVRIWPGDAPGSEGKETSERWMDGTPRDAFHRVTDIHVPSLTVYLPEGDNSARAAVLIAPGGGHRYLVVDLEGEMVARKFNALGVAAFVLRNRLARAEGSTYRVEVESFADLRQAIRLVRGRAAEWGVDPSRVGVVGFSAGGHLAALSSNDSDPATRPDFAVLAYPGFGSAGIPAISSTVSPTFMYVNDDDSLATGVGEYYLALRKAKASAEFHSFRRGGHGTGATGREGPANFEKLGASKWFELASIWMKDLGFLR